ncbi:hypothetical protein OAC51_02170 [Flavobacteriaceae bacterium]|nr:hypothetical protein [Flavobacteriaceae bacterium]
MNQRYCNTTFKDFFETHATYHYNEDGSLRRTELGDNLQGIDYVYTLGGQLKSINAPKVADDPGQDGQGSSAFPADVFGMSLDYYSGDYLRSNTPQPVYSSSSGSDQFNGNIKAQRWFTQGQNDAPAYTYEYNKNQWLEKASFGQHDAARITTNAQDDFGVSGLTYDANGNLLSLTRNKNTASGSNVMDALTYKYKDGTNQLDHVVDAAGDVPDAADIGTQTPNNYIYNSIGQLTDNKDEKVGYVYNTAGLVTQITKNGATQLSIQYNDRGQRLSKTTPSGTTHYVRDAAGSVLGIYFDQSLTEQPVYGNSRLGVRYRASGKTAYQLSDHLGNVRAVVMENEGQTLSLTNRADYYPFGMPMPNRQTTDGDYRYAYQGQEKDKETNKEAFELRLWDSRIGRWLTTDPKRQYSSPYLGMGNDPINGIDPDGGWKTKLGAFLWKTFNGGGQIVGASGNWSVAQQGADGFDTFTTNGSFKTQREEDNPFWTRLNTQQQYSYPKTEFYAEAQINFNIGGIGVDIRAFGSKFSLFGEAGRNSIYSFGGGYNTEEGSINHTSIGLPKKPNRDFGLSAGKGLGLGVNFNDKLSITKSTHSTGLTNLIIEYHTEDIHLGQTKIKSISSEQEFGGSFNFIYGVEGYIKFGVRQINE